MKRLVFIITGLFIAAVFTVGAAGYLASRDEGAPASRTEVAETRTTIPKAELARHASSADCWIALRGKVYDVTRYIDEHPAPRDTILRTCGTDATEAFATKGGEGRPHSTAAWARLETMKIGEYAP